MTITLIYIGLNLLIWIVFKRYGNPFKKIWFWLTCLISNVLLSILFVFILLLAIGGRKAVEGWNREYFNNGKLLSEFFIKDGKEEGVSRMWYSNGQLESYTKYKNGQAIDTSFIYYENGVIHFLELYDNDESVLSISYYENGAVESKTYNPIDSNDNNFRIDYYPNGTKKFETKISNSTFNGKGFYYFANGQIQYTGNYKDGQKDSIWIKFDSITNKVIDKDTFNYNVPRIFKDSWK